MDIQSFSVVDVCIVVAVFISTIFGWCRGATKETLSLLSWIGSIVLSVVIFPHVKGIARANISHGLIADFVTACVLFVSFLTLLSVFNYVCSNFVKKSAISNVDKFLGAIFGIVRGIIFVAAVDMTASQWLLNGDVPEFLEKSKLRSQVINVANSIIIMFPNSLQDQLVGHMSKINKNNLIAFIAGNTSANPNKAEQKKLVQSEAVLKSEEEFVMNTAPIDKSQDREAKNQEHEARRLATLKPKENNVPSSESVAPKKTGKEILDMKRFLDQNLDTEQDIAEE
jgi:membrane protein required for colicin V production